MRLTVVLLSTSVGILWPLAVSADSGNSSWCGTLMCVSALTNGNIITYELRALNQLGWMSIGFGSQMNETPLVIMWPNGDGSVTLSQRQASGHNEPVPVASPPRTATVSPRTDLSDATSPVLAFDIPQSTDDDSDKTLIWAFGVTRPDPEPDADLVQHLDAGAFVLAERKHGDGDGDDGVTSSASATQSTGATSVSSLLSSPTPTSSPSSSSLTLTLPPSLSSALTSTNSVLSSVSSSAFTSGSLPSPTQIPDSTLHASNLHVSTLLAAHASLSFLGFAFFLPLSALFVRWSRTFTHRWQRIHWLTMLLLSSPCMIVGWTLGPLAVSRQGHHHVVNEHQIGGVALFALCLVQMLFGALVHLHQPKDGQAHPPRNIIHVALGLFIIGFAFFETKTGVTRDRLLSDDTKKILAILSILWAVVVAVAYLIGLTFLRKQLDQERLGWHLALASRPSSHVRSAAPISEGSTNQSPFSSPGHSSSRLLRWLNSRVSDSPPGLQRSLGHQSAGSSSVPEVRPEASVVTLVEMREVRSTVPISVIARDTVPEACHEFVEQTGV